MTKNSVADALRELAKTDKNRSGAARLFELIDEVEATLKAGVRRETVLKTLNDNDFKMTLKSFESALYRIRKKRGKLATTTTTSANPLTIEKPVAVQTPTPAPATQVQTETKQAETETETETKPKATWMSPTEIRRRRQENMEKIDRDFESYSE